MWVALEYSTGAALTPKDGSPITLSNVATDLTPEMAQTATLALKGRVVRSGTKVRAAYRWQPSRLVTAVDPYGAFSDQAFLSCYLRQAIRLGTLLPEGLEATVDVTNLLAQGYHPFLSADGRTLFLAQSPRHSSSGWPRFHLSIAKKPVKPPNLWITAYNFLARTNQNNFF